MAKSVKRLYRSKNDRMIAGICGGLGEYANIDPTIVRLMYVLLTVFTAVVPGVIAYFILWIIVPEK